MQNRTSNQSSARNNFTSIVKIAAVSLVLSAIFVFINARAARAETKIQPHMFLAWHAETYVPHGYEGRALPAANSLVYLTLDVIDEGKRVDLSPYPIRWYLGETPIKNGEGLDRITVRIPNIVGEGTYKVRAQINNYKEQTLIKVVNIPVAAPRAVIVDSTDSPQATPFRGGLPLNASLELEGVPYFFNVKRLSELVFEWIVNGRQSSDYENPDQNLLFIKPSEDTSSGKAVLVGLSVHNPLFELEYASHATTFTYAP